MIPNPQVNGKPSQKQCPVCGRRLWVEFEGDRIWLWCPYGPCTDSRMNDGALADTLEAAYQILCKRAYNETPQR